MPGRSSQSRRVLVATTVPSRGRLGTRAERYTALCLGVSEPISQVNLCRCFCLTKRLTQIGKESVDLLHCAAVPLDFTCPVVGFRVGDQLDLALAACAQAWRVL